MSAFNRTELTPTDFVVLLVAACVFHMGMVSIAEYITGQKTITMRSFYNGIKVRRDNTCYVIWTSVFFCMFWSSYSNDCWQLDEINFRCQTIHEIHDFPQALSSCRFSAVQHIHSPYRNGVDRFGM